MQRGKISIFATFGGHLGFLKKCEYLENRKRYSDFERIFDPPGSTRVSHAGGKISIFATFGGHLGFFQKMKKFEYLQNRKR